MKVRPITNFVQGYTKTTDADRATIGITVRDTSRTPSPTPTTRPLVSVDPGTRLTHQLRLVDEGSPTRRGKPEGVAGAEVWVKLVDTGAPAPTDPIGDPRTLSFLTLTSRPSPHMNLPHRVQVCRRREDGGLHAAVGQNAGREGAVVGCDERDGGGVRRTRRTVGVFGPCWMFWQTRIEPVTLITHGDKTTQESDRATDGL